MREGDSTGARPYTVQVGIALNPRFTDRVDWSNVLYGSQKWVVVATGDNSLGP